MGAPGSTKGRPWGRYQRERVMEKEGRARVGRLRLLWWWLVDRVDYASTLARLWVYDRIAGPFPMTDADVVREREIERLQRAFPDVDVDSTGPRRGSGAGGC